MGWVAPFALLFIATLAWRGYRRGATRTIQDWLPTLAALPVLVLFFWLAFLWADHLLAIGFSGMALAFIVALVVHLAIRRRRRAHRPPAMPPEDPSTWSERLNRVGGAVLGLVNAAMLCLLLGLAGSLTIFTCGQWVMGDAAVDAEQPGVTQVLGEVCLEIAAAADLGLAGHIPGLASASREVQALIEVLNASETDRAQLATELDLVDLIEVREVNQALNDDEYIKLIERFGEGRIHLVTDLVRHPRSKELMNCRQLQDKVKGLTPSKLRERLLQLKAEAEFNRTFSKTTEEP